MATWLLITGLVLLVMEIFVGMVANGFIVLFNFIDWFRSRKLSPNDLILTCLGLARLSGQAITILDITMYSFFLGTYVLTEVRSTITLMWLFINNINIWFAACLGVWYLMKIAIFSHPVFLQVKQRISQWVPWLLWGSVIFSAFVTIILTGWSRKLTTRGLHKSLFNNTNASETEMPLSFRRFVIAVTVLNSVPFVIFLSSTILLIASLWKHIRRLQHNGIRVRDVNTSVHLNAIKALVSFAVLYLCSFAMRTSNTVLAWRRSDRSLTSVLFPMMSALYPSGHAIILILINPKLKQAWLRMVRHLKFP